METPKLEGNKTEQELERETHKWLKKLEMEYPQTKPTGILGKKEMRSVTENIEAYLKDCKFFMEKQDWVRAFEAIVYAWGIYETALRTGLMSKG